MKKKILLAGAVALMAARCCNRVFGLQQIECVGSSECKCGGFSKGRRRPNDVGNVNISLSRNRNAMGMFM